MRCGFKRRPDWLVRRVLLAPNPPIGMALQP